LEALSSGLFCITSRAGALPEIINSNNGILIDEINPNEIINALKISLINKDQIFKKRKLISKESIDRFDIENIIKKLNKIYNQR
jgi:L-malate glycosyltransferase